MGWPTLAAVARGEDWWAIPAPHDEEQRLVAIKFCLATTEGPEGGRISLTSTDPGAPPGIDHGFLGAIDSGAFDTAWDAFQALLETETFRAAGAEDPHGDLPLRERLLRFVISGAHPAGGCPIGPVVSPDLEVHGVAGLSVADASVFPRHVTNNPNTTCFVIGEIAARRILAGPAPVRTPAPHRLETV
jgi:choline dehydrogenase